MLNRLPKFIDPIVLADKNASMKGKLPLNNLERLKDFMANDDGDVDASLSFVREGKLVKIEGQLSAKLALKCQRCLEAVEWSYGGEFMLGVVTSIEQIDKLPEYIEPLLLINEDKVQLKDLIEDELLLGLPTIPLHQYDCGIPDIPVNTLKPKNQVVEKQKENPFSILADIKNLKKLETTNGSTKE